MLPKKTVLSAVQPTNQLHLGNYLGAIRNWIPYQDEYECIFFAVDLHSITSGAAKADPEALRENTYRAIATYIACGIDPKKSILFAQSQVPAHTELAWVLTCHSSMGELSRMTQFKDKSSKHGTHIPTGLFIYPVLMAADILMYDADVVPVGRDQEQHVEIARELAGKYNRAYVETFKMPQAYIKKDVATVPGVDGTKMSKSKGNTIPLFASDEEITKAVMSIVTDSARPEDKKNPDENNIYQIHKLFLTEEEDAALRARYTDGGLGYKEAKEICRDAIINFVAPMRVRYDYYQANPDEVWEILKNGGAKARARARVMMDKIRKDTGLDR